MIRGNLRLTVPNPHREKIGIDLLMRILRQAGISKEEWMEKE
jgi:predicted RNA binding protein YcfA (HicA-like mRNA interferase family)